MIESGFWLLALSAAWLGSQAALWGVALVLSFDFPAFHPTAWTQLYALFAAGGTISFDFVAVLGGAVIVTAGGQIWLVSCLPSLLSWLPPLPQPRMTPLPRQTRRQRREPQPPLPQRPTPPRPTPPPISPAPAGPAGKGADSACVARMLALFEVWNEPPSDWIKEAMRDEASQLGDQGWPLLRELGAVGVRLAALLLANGMVPQRPAILAALEDLMALASGSDAPAPAPVPDLPPPLSTGAAWLCELLDHFAPDDGQTAEDLLGRAIRGMTAEDWASLDRFPEKAGQVRVLTDRMAEDFRRSGKTTPCPPSELLDSLLRQFGFETRPSPLKDSIWAERQHLALLVKLTDLKQRRWRLPSGPSGPWLDPDGAAGADLGRELWQQLSMLRLRRPAGTRLDGIVVAHNGSFEDETALRDRSADGVRLVWLNEQGGALPDLQNYLRGLGEERVRVRPQASAEHAAAALP